MVTSGGRVWAGGAVEFECGVVVLSADDAVPGPAGDVPGGKGGADSISPDVAWLACEALIFFFSPAGGAVVRALEDECGECNDYECS